MQIELLDFVAGARAARGVVIIIDVFRAFSVACYASARGAPRIIPVGEIEEALQLKRAHPDYLAIGERHARKLPGFDSGNSPTEIEGLDLSSRTVVHTTHAGTQGLVNAHQAEVVLTGSFVNAAAIIRYIHALAPVRVSLVRMGMAAMQHSDADDLCAELLAARLSGLAPLADLPGDSEAIRERLRESPEADKFFDPAADWAPERDFELCTALDRFDFVLRLQDEADGLRSLRAIAT
jgi:2-phosphosulfolactate phosphatase